MISKYNAVSLISFRLIWCLLEELHEIYSSYIKFWVFYFLSFIYLWKACHTKIRIEAIILSFYSWYSWF